MHKTQGWKTTTPDGDKREVRATKKGHEWRFQSRLKGETAWTYHDTPLLEDLESLFDLLQRKYKRNRAPFEEVEKLEKLVAERHSE